MNFRSPLYRGILVQRTGKVLVDAYLNNGQLITGYCPNMTELKALTTPQSEIYFSLDSSLYKRLRYTWELAQSAGTLIGVNCDNHLPLVMEAISTGALYELSGYDEMRPPKAPSLLDLELISANDKFPNCQVAIIPVYHKKGADLLFPDAIDTGNRHILKQLESALNRGERAVLLPIAQRIDCLGVRADWLADAEYINELKNLCEKGLEIICCGCTVSVQGIWITARLPFTF